MAFRSIARRSGGGVAHRRAFLPSRRLHRRQEFLLADIGEGIAEVEVLKWFVKPGDRIEQFQKICEVQSDKATVEITSRFDGTITSLNVDMGKMAKVGASLVTLDIPDEEGNAPPSSQEAAPENTENSPSVSAEPERPISEEKTMGKILTTPSVRRLSREYNLDLTKITATGPNGRLLKSDVLSAIAASSTQSTPKSAEIAQDEIRPISGLMRIMAKTMTASGQIPTLTLHEEIVANELHQLRASLKLTLPKLTYLPLILKAISLALREFPQLNAHVDDDCTTVTLKSEHNIAIAMDTPRGLIVPVIRRIQDRSIAEISEEISRLSALGAEGKLGKEDLQGGTFAMSNIGAIGGTYATPLIVRPQVVIGAIGRIQSGMARFDQFGEVKNTSIMAMSWSADHRVVDGATIARFSKRVKTLLESPSDMLLLTKSFSRNFV